MQNWSKFCFEARPCQPVFARTSLTPCEPENFIQSVCLWVQMFEWIILCHHFLGVNKGITRGPNKPNISWAFWAPGIKKCRSLNFFQGQIWFFQYILSGTEISQHCQGSFGLLVSTFCGPFPNFEGNYWPRGLPYFDPWPLWLVFCNGHKMPASLTAPKFNSNSRLKSVFNSFSITEPTVWNSPPYELCSTAHQERSENLHVALLCLILPFIWFNFSLGTMVYMKWCLINALLCT